MTPRQRNQIRAALTFWSAVAETSRVHPIAHPKVQPFFGTGQPTPLTEDEIADLIVLFGQEQDNLRPVTIAYAARGTGLTAARLRHQVWRDAIRPIEFPGCPLPLYNPLDLIASARKIAERDAEQRKKYHVGT